MRNFALESGLSGPNSIKKQAITYIMKKFILDLKVSSVEALSPKHVLIKLTDEKPLPDMLPGQFVEVRVDDSPSTFLRRPIPVTLAARRHAQLCAAPRQRFHHAA